VDTHLLVPTYSLGGTHLSGGGRPHAVVVFRKGDGLERGSRTQTKGRIGRRACLAGPKICTRAAANPSLPIGEPPSPAFALTV
jgi:hypothetical protein